MLRSSLWRVVFAFLLVLALAAPAVRAAERRSSRGSSVGASDTWNLLGQTWSYLVRLWAEHGCILDPSGRCQPEPGDSSVTSDHGCILDPNGRCIG